MMPWRRSSAPEVAKLFAPFQLSNAERSVLVRWATFPLDGTELKYEIEPIPGWNGRFRVRVYINYRPEPLTGAIESADAHRIVEAHKSIRLTALLVRLAIESMSYPSTLGQER